MKPVMYSYKDKKGMKIAHVEASNVMPTIAVPQLNENASKRVDGNALKGVLLKNFPKENRGRL